MRWKKGRRSSHVEDRRGSRISSGGIKGGIGTIVIALALSYFLGIDPMTFLKMQQGGGSATTATDWQPSAADKEAADFVSVVLADTEDTWNAIFRNASRRLRVWMKSASSLVVVRRRC